MSISEVLKASTDRPFLAITMITILVVLGISGLLLIQFKLAEIKEQEKAKHYNGLHHFYRVQLAQGNRQQLMVVGDSHVQSMNVLNISHRAINLGIGGDTIEGVTQRVKDYLANSELRHIALLVGTNNLLRENVETSKARMDTLASTLEPAGQVYWIATPPASPARIEIEKTEQLNRYIATLCKNLPRCVYIAPFNDAKAGQALLAKDGIHLRPAGYEYLTSMIRQDIIKPDQSDIAGDERATQNL
ncbi:MAG: GDSL-type esterase/lipase family protein [Ketobacteraceae bacterium]|nr:GDSL-type esterase/lipase family protein [Ketobacteraceae bacterium]